MIIGIKVIQKLTFRKGEIVALENCIGDRDCRVYIRFYDNGEKKKFEFSGRFFNFFEATTEEDKQKILYCIEKKKREFKEKAEAIAKAEAKDFFIKRGHKINNKTPFRFASINNAVAVYWVNPKVEDVKKKWYLALRDQKNKITRLFLMDSNDNTVLGNMLKLATKSDNPKLIHLEILADDICFKDRKSGVEFAPYLIDEVNY